MAKPNDTGSIRTTKLTDRPSLWVAVFCLGGALLLFLAEPVIQQRLARRGVFTESTGDSVDPAGQEPPAAETTSGSSIEALATERPDIVVGQGEVDSPRSMFDAGQSTYSLFWLKAILLVLGSGGLVFLFVPRKPGQQLQ